jgi:hypothetical protein
VSFFKISLLSSQSVLIIFGQTGKVRRKELLSAPTLILFLVNVIVC